MEELKTSTVDGKALEEALSRDWVARQQATRIVGTSAEWVWQLSNRGQIEALSTPLGKLYRRSQALRCRAGGSYAYGIYTSFAALRCEGVMRICSACGGIWTGRTTPMACGTRCFRRSRYSQDRRVCRTPGDTWASS